MAGTGHHGAWSRTARTGLVATGLLALLVLGGLVLVPPAPPGLAHSSVLNVLFDSRWVVGGVRLVVLAVALYLLLSIVVRVEQDQWLKHVGPADVETDETVRQLTDDQADLQARLADADRTIAELRQQLQGATARPGLAAGAGRADTGG